MACPQCKGAVPPRQDNPAFPFCCERCRLLDLGAWLDERYRVPGDPVDGEAHPPSRTDQEE
jgi:endogenous inhibitor of DNA gyrase (YacG/DUF329 family)